MAMSDNDPDRHVGPGEAALNRRKVGYCADCSWGDHSHHNPNLGGICIGCACAENEGSDDR